MTKLHPKAVYLFWWQYFWSFLIIFVIGGTLLHIGLLRRFDFNGMIGLVTILTVLALVASAIWSRLFYNSYSFDITKEYILIKWGVIIKHSASIPYARIQNIDVNRGIMARILGLSEVWIQTAGFSAALTKYGSLRSMEGLIPGLDQNEAEKVRKTILKKLKGRQKGGL